MMHPYVTFPDETEVVFSHIMGQNDAWRIEVHFERPREGGFDSARCVLPDHQWLFRDGFAEHEMRFFEEFLRYNARLIYHLAKQGGIPLKPVDDSTGII